MPKDTKTPNIALNDDALFHLKKIFDLTRIITNLVNNASLSELTDLLKGNKNKQIRSDPALQHALIFCFKMIGMRIDKASEILGLKAENMPLFWQELHFLRNSFIHHCPTTSMPLPALDLLASMSTKIGHIYKYFSLIVDAKNTLVDFKGEKYKVFFDVNELATKLREQAFSRDVLRNTSQVVHLNRVLTAIKGLSSITENLKPLNEITINSLSYKNYYALQNLCELIATIMNPNPQYSLLTDETINAIRKQHRNSETWLRSLGESRNDAVHNTGIIPSRNLATHITELQLLEREVLLNTDFQNNLRVVFTKLCQF